MFPAVFVEQVQFFLRRQAAGSGRLPKLTAIDAVRRLAGVGDIKALFPQRFGEEARLSGFAGAINPFEDDE